MNELFTLLTSKSDKGNKVAKQIIKKHLPEIKKYKSMKMKINNDVAVIFNIYTKYEVFNKIVEEIQEASLPCK